MSIKHLLTLYWRCLIRSTTNVIYNYGNYLKVHICNLTSHLLLPPATKLREGNVFTPVCDSVHGSLCLGGVSVQGGLCPGGLSVRETPMVTCGQYASYCNTFLVLYGLCKWCPAKPSICFQPYRLLFSLFTSSFVHSEPNPSFEFSRNTQCCHFCIAYIEKSKIISVKRYLQ